MRRNISKGGVPVDYDRIIEYIAHSKVEQQELGSRLLALTHSNDSVFSSVSFKSWVKRLQLVKGFNLTDKGNVSFDDTSLESFIQTNAYGDEITEIVKKYRVFSYLGSQVLQLPSIINAYKPSGLQSADGRRLIMIKPGVETQNTGRFGLVNPAFMNLPRYMKDLVVAPRGWTILSADSGQIEPKLIYGFFLKDKQIQKLIEVYGDAYYAILHYCRMPQSDITNHVMDFTPVEITDELKSLRKRLKTYGNAVMYGSTSNPDNDSLKQKYIERIGQHPLRIDWQNRVETEILSGKTVFNTIFGTPIDISKSDKVRTARDDRMRMISMIHCGINNPIQGTAGDCMGFSIKFCDELISKKAPNSWITKYVHDEGQYCIYNDELPYVQEELCGSTAYDLGGVVKVFNDPVVGRHWNKDVPTSYTHLFEEE